MKSQLDHIDEADLGVISESYVIHVDIPEDFREMDVSSRIRYVSDQLQTLESEYPGEVGTYRRHTSLVKIENDEFLYLVKYIPVLDDEY